MTTLGSSVQTLGNLFRNSIRVAPLQESIPPLTHRGGFLGVGLLDKLLPARCIARIHRRGEGATTADDAAPLGVTLLPLEKLLAQADIVTLHATLTEQTRGLIDAATLRLFKPGSFLINLGRGGLIADLDALHQALESGRLRGVALDTFEPEPPDLDHPIFTHERCICSPHVLGLTPGAMERTYRSMAADMAAVLAGERPRFCVNPQTLKHP